MTDRGTKLSRTEESLERAREALERNLGTETEQDWHQMVERYEQRVEKLRKSP